MAVSQVSHHPQAAVSFGLLVRKQFNNVGGEWSGNPIGLRTQEGGTDLDDVFQPRMSELNGVYTLDTYTRPTPSAIANDRAFLPTVPGQEQQISFNQPVYSFSEATHLTKLMRQSFNASASAALEGKPAIMTVAPVDDQPNQFEVGIWTSKGQPYNVLSPNVGNVMLNQVRVELHGDGNKTAYYAKGVPSLVHLDGRRYGAVLMDVNDHLKATVPPKATTLKAQSGFSIRDYLPWWLGGRPKQ